MSRVDDLKSQIQTFNNARDWARFHSPKNLSMALMVEASELAEVFQWLTEEESYALPPDKLTRAEEEIADVLIYLINLADKLGIDPLDAAAKKLKVNSEKYPVENARGSAKKYTEF